MTTPVPLRREPVLQALRALEPELRAKGIESLFLFGSVARDEAGEESDIDLFCELNPEAHLGWSYFSLRPYFEELLGRAVDFTTRRGLHRLIRDEVQEEAVRVF